MRTKRKRAWRKPPARKSAALAKHEKAVDQSEKAVNRNEKAVNRNEKAVNQDEKPVNQSEKAVNQSEEAFLSFINQNRKENSVSADSNDLEVVESDPDEAKSNSSSLSSSSDSDESFSVEESSSDDSLSADRRSRKLTKGPGNGKQKASKLLKKGRNDDVKSSRVLRSSSKKQDEFKMPQQDPRYNMKELKAALKVIKKIMKMDEAQPFAVSVDPVASGKPDYFNVIDTPMDFGTICSNLENSIKYMNSEDVFNDVQYIWENCCKFYKKGEYIVYLMKRVKKKFMKYWISAGLSIEQSRMINVGTLHKPSTTDYATRHSRREPFYPAGSAVDGASQMQLDRLGFNQHYPYLPPLCYSQPHQLPQPPPTTAWPQFSQLPPVSYHQPCQSQHPQSITNQPQFSQSQAHTGCNSAGYSHFLPSGDIAPKHKKHASKSKHKKNLSMGPASIYGGPPEHSQSQQLHLSYELPYGPQQHPQSISQQQSSQLQAVVDGGHSHLLPQADYTRSRGCAPQFPVDPMLVTGQLHPQQSPSSHGESSKSQQLQPKASHCQPQSSNRQDNVDIEHSHMSLTDSALRGIRCALRYSAGPTANKSNEENQEQLGLTEVQRENTPQSLEQQRLTKKKRGRGPTRCLFLNDLADGERIFVHINKFGQPVGPKSSKLSSFLGTVARNGHKAPLNFVHWRAMPDSYKEEMWEYVQTKFDIDPSGKPWVMQSIATKWRDWKADLKAAYYDSFKTDEERLKASDPRVIPDQWPSLIAYWNSDDTKKRCATNRANRLKQMCGHSSGTKSYARICEEERNKRPDGKEPTRAELYILTHTRKNGQPVDETAAEFISKIRKQEAKKQNTSQCSDESNDTLCQVMGVEKSDRVQSYGMGPNHTGVFARRPRRDVLVRMASEAKKSANEEVRKMVVKMEAMEEKYALMENHIARMTSKMEKFLEKIGRSSGILGSEQHFLEDEVPGEDDA